MKLIIDCTNIISCPNFTQMLNYATPLSDNRTRLINKSVIWWRIYDVLGSNEVRASIFKKGNKKRVTTGETTQ